MLRRLGFWLGLLLLAAAAAALLRDLWLWLGAGEGFSLHSVSDHWAAMDGAGLAALEPALPGWLWKAVVSPILKAPPVAIFGVPGLLLLRLCRPRRVRRFY